MTLSLWFDDLFIWISQHLIDFEYQNLIYSLIYIVFMGFLLFRLWSTPRLPKKHKVEWTFLILFFSFFSGLYFIWKKDDEFRAF